MADVIDRAQVQSDFYLRHQIRKAAECPVAQSERFCAECGDPIPEARRKAVPGCNLCVICRAELESNKG